MSALPGRSHRDWRPTAAGEPGLVLLGQEPRDGRWHLGDSFAPVIDHSGGCNQAMQCPAFPADDDSEKTGAKEQVAHWKGDRAQRSSPGRQCAAVPPVRTNRDTANRPN